MASLNKEKLIAALACAALAIPLFAVAAEDADEKAWAEGEVHLPAFPEKENLIPFTVGAVTDRQFFIDSKSLSVGADGVIRFALVIVSSAGAQNISYEGLRCGAGERRYYASGRADKTWSKARSDKWLKVRGAADSHHVELYMNYFCPNAGSAVRSADDARHSLRTGGQPIPKGS